MWRIYVLSSAAWDYICTVPDARRLSIAEAALRLAGYSTTREEVPEPVPEPAPPYDSADLKESVKRLNRNLDEMKAALKKAGY